MESFQITPQDLKVKMKPYLEGTMLGLLIDRVNLQTDGQGNVLPHVIRNIKTTLSTAMKMTSDVAVKTACENTLGELNTLLGE